MRSKIESYLGFAAKARKLVSGTSTCIFTMSKGKAKLLIVASDISENSKQKLLDAANKNKVEYRIYGESDALSKISGTSGRSAFVLTDKQFAECILREIDSMQRV